MANNVKKAISALTRIGIGAGLALVMLGCYLFSQGNLSFTKIEQTHSAQVIVDGDVVSDTSWTELFGYSVQINLVDGAYVGR